MILVISGENKSQTFILSGWIRKEGAALKVCFA